MAGNLKNWRESASLILLAKQTFRSATSTEKINYKVLTMKRSSQSSFMPNTQVFPGGTLDKSDCSSDWLKLYKKFGINEEYFNIFKNVKYIAPIFKNQNNDAIPKFISLRICAIREAFEECGVLMCKTSKQKNDGKLSSWASYFGGFDITEWQKRVHNDPTTFIELCSKFEIYPDIWALHEWSNWLTPVAMKKRFDTCFFLAHLQNVIPTFAEEKEVQLIQWDSPLELLKKYEQSEIFLPPPQYYEFHRLLNFSNIEDLSDYSKKRSLCGTERILPYILATDKFQVNVLPGDELYPGEDQAQVLNTEILENITEGEVMHRIVHTDSFKHTCYIKNYSHKIEHVYPVINKNNQSSKF